jgi:hypothetical protein
MPGKDYPSSGAPADPRLSRAIDSAEIERRLAGLEDSTKRLENHLTERRLADLEESQKRLEITQNDRNLRSMTIVFAAMTALITVTAILVSVLTWGSKTETREATKDMQSNVDKAIAAMEKRFELLAGDALKKPSLQIMWDQRPLDGQIIELSVPNVSPMQFLLHNFFLANSGDRRTDPLSISVLMPARVAVSWDHQDWENGPSPDRDYTVGFNSTRTSTTVAAKQMLNVHPLSVMIVDNILWPTNMPCKIQVYYGGDKPAEAHFQLKLKMR